MRFLAFSRAGTDQIETVWQLTLGQAFATADILGEAEAVLDKLASLAELPRACSRVGAHPFALSS